VARALGKAHAAGIVHRDVKPENIFLVRDDDSEIAKVLDFGIAQHATSEPNGGSRSILGTPFYMSPEQASGATRVDHRSDLFSLAVIVYQCLTGELPFVGNDVKDVFTQILHAPVPVPSHKAADLPPSFDGWWARASSRDASNRYQTAKELAEALNLSLRISEILEVASLMPRAEVGSTGRISIVAGSLSALASAQMSAGPTLAIQTTLDESYSRTFEPDPVFRKPRMRLFAGLGLAAVLLVGFAFSRGGDTEPAAKETSSAANTAPVWPEPPSVASAAAPVAMATPPPSPPAHVERVETKVSTAVHGRPLPKLDSARAAPRRSGKPAKTAVARPADDFGI
jgi:serine/threonine-protein kinase